MVHLAVYDISPNELDRGPTPVCIGVPVPESAELVDLENIVLVGAEMAQFQPVSFWPDGSVKWLLIDAMVELPSGQRKAALYLTTGQAAKDGASLAEERENEIFVETGAASYSIPKDGSILIHQFAVEKLALPNVSLQLNNGKQGQLEFARTGFAMEKNGPVTSVVAIEGSVATEAGPIAVTTRITSSREQTHIKLEVSAYLPTSATTTVAIPNLNLVFGGMTDEESGVVSELEGSWRQNHLRSGPHEFIVCFEGSGSSNGIMSSGNDRVMRVFPDQGEMMTLQPGSLVRREIFLDLLPEDDSVARISNPLLGKGSSVDTYNDTDALVEKVLIGGQERSPAKPSTNDTFDTIALSLYEILGEPDPASDDGFIELRSKLDELLKSGAMMRTLPGEAISLWYFLTGDEAVRKACLDWGKWFEMQLQSTPERQEGVESLAQLLDLYRLTGAEETRDRVWQWIEAWLPLDGEGDELFRLRAMKSGRPLLVLISNLIRHARFDPAIEDRLLDALERLVYLHRENHPSDRVFSEGYLLTGDPNFLKEGREILDDKDYTDHKTSLRHLMASPLRQYVWRELPIQLRPESNGTLSLSWTVPRQAVRLRIKHANVPIVTGPAIDGDDTVSFYAAKNLDGEPELRATGEEQSMRIPVEAGAGERYFAARYLERGTALPAPAPVRPTVALETEEDAFGLNHSFKILLLAVAALATASFLKWRGKRAR